MKQPYATPELVRVSSIEDLTLASGSGSLVDICLSISTGGNVQVNGGVSVPGGSCMVS